MPDITSAGERQIATLQEILRRCEAVGERVQFSGEGGERRFRHWLATDFLDEVLGWPSTQILVGERFDVTLLSDETVPLITIETKTPYHTASAKEKRDFEGRLSALPTLRYAIFTNGEDWERYRLERTSDGFIIEQDGSFALSVGPALKVQTFFKPLEYSGRQALPQGYRFRISKDEPFLQSALARLTADLEGVIADLIIYYSSLFQGFREGHAGPDAKSITEAIYEKWSGDSLRVRPSQLADAISSVLRQDPTLPAVLSAMRNYGFSGDMAQQVAETILALPAKAQREASNVEGQVWPLFEPSVRQLCAQTAHVQVARILLYRVGEDEDVFEKKLIGSALQSILSAPTHDVQGWKFAVSDALESVRVMMHTFLPSVYELSEFDWWMVKTDVRSLLTNRHQDWLLPRDEERERILHRALQKFSRYSFEAVDLDIWRNLYERYLPPDERQKLGGFYTPDPLINLVLDLAGYDSETPGLCNLSYIDPACGSGAFVTNALGRLIRHLDSPMPCHSPLHERNSSPMQRREALLRIVERNVNAIDLHPFASFLTTMNVLFTILPRYVRARNDNPRFSMTLNVFSWDALDQPGVGSDDQARLNLWRKMNSRMERSERDHERYVKLVTTGFDRVFGNPPWGGVLKGPLAPVYEQRKKEAFAAVYMSAAQGKYDIYGLFFERALRLLHKNGEFALITQSTFLEKEWAEGLRGLLSTEATLRWIVDLGPFGQLFFNAMNAPCITVATKTLPNGDEQVGAIVSRNPKFPVSERARRQQFVADQIERVVSALDHGQAIPDGFATGSFIDQRQLKETISSRWNLQRSSADAVLLQPHFAASDLLEVRQGVTPGGCLDLFLMSKAGAERLELEEVLVHKAIKSKQIKRWFVDWSELGRLCTSSATLA